MHEPKPIRPDVHWVGVNDRDTDIFEGLWPLPRGVSYNSYLILDEKTVLIDTVKSKSLVTYCEKVRQLLAGRPLDYLVVNHMEPDHSGGITTIRTHFPGVTVIGNQKTARFLQDFYRLSDGVQVVADGEVLSLGKHRLQFFLTPMVHWPETMVTYEQTEGILFSGDAFGGFGALDGGIFDDEVDLEYYEDEILRYFSNIVGKYCTMVQKAIAKLQGLDIRVIAATHGPIWRHAPGQIVKLYDRWSRQEAEPGVVLAYGSMYGNTERMMEAVARGIVEEGFNKVRVHNVSRVHVSFILRDAWRYQALVLGSPTYDTDLYPPMDALVRLFEAKKLKGRILGVVGSCGWSGGAVARLQAFAQSSGWDLVNPVIEARCAPTVEDLESCRLLGRQIVARLRQRHSCLG